MKRTIPKRLFWADNLRIIAIFFVLHLHTQFFPFDKISVPLFVMVSGALLLEKQESHGIFFRKRILKVFIPWFFWTLIYMTYFYYFDRQATATAFFSGHIEQGTITQWLHFFLRTFFSGLWFLPMIFSLYLLTPILRKVIKYASVYEKWYMIIIWFLFFSLFPYIFSSSFFPKYEPNLFFTAFQYCGYFLLGVELIKIKSTKLILIVMSALLLCTALFLPRESGFIHPFIVFASTAFYYLVFTISNIADNHISSQRKKFIAVLSGTCLGVYVIHGLLWLLWGTSIHKTLENVKLGFTAPLVLFGISVITILFLQKIPIVKRIVP